MVDDDRCRGQNRSPTPVMSDGGQRFDEIFAALADLRRRRVLHYLREEEQASRSAAARQIAAWEHECPPDDVPQEALDTLDLELFHLHLPHLQKADVVEYDRRSEMLVFRDPPELVVHCLDYCAARDLPA